MADARKVSRYRRLGEGSSLALNLLTVAGLLALWWVATHQGWIRPLFLPKPEAVATAWWIATFPGLVRTGGR